MSMKRQKLITSIDDLVDLNIIDWGRLNGTSKSPLVAMRDISSWFIGRAVYTIVDYDLRLFPQRDDFPNWKHPGGHVPLAKLYWNCFHSFHDRGELFLSDEPDFYGTLKFEDGEKKKFFYDSSDMGDAHFWGDFGSVSASAFALTAIRKMEAHDLWISILDSHTQVIIEALESISESFSTQLGIK